MTWKKFDKNLLFNCILKRNEISLINYVMIEKQKHSLVLDIFLLDDYGKESLYKKDFTVSSGKQRKIFLEYLPAKNIKFIVTRGVYINIEQISVWGIPQIKIDDELRELLLINTCKILY